MEKDLNELLTKLKTAAGTNLKTVVLYGSAATGEFQPKYSDLNVLCVLEHLGASELEKLNASAVWWARKGHPAPLVFAWEELKRMADLFAVELLDIKAAHRVLFGEDVFVALAVPMDLHRVQVEHELRSKQVHLRQHYLAAPHDAKTVLGLMTDSFSSFLVLFRHALIAMGERSSGKREAIDRLAELAGLDASAFYAVLEVREGRRRMSEGEVASTFRGYLEGVTRVADEVDRWLAAGM